MYQNKNLSSGELLKLENAVTTIHQRKLQVLVTEIFKVKNNLSREIMKQVFDFQEPHYNLRSETSQFRRENMKTHYDMQSIKNLGPKIWAWYLKMLKTKSLQEFKRLIKLWKPEAFPCRLCKKYVAHICFIWLNIYLL